MKKSQKKTPAGRRRPWPRFLALQGKSKQTGPAGRWWGPAQQLCKSKHHTSSTRPLPKPVFGADPCRRKPCWRSQSRPLGAGASHMLAAPPPPIPNTASSAGDSRGGNTEVRQKTAFAFLAICCSVAVAFPNRSQLSAGWEKTGSYFGSSASSTQRRG